MVNDAGSGNTAGEFKIAAVTPEADAMLEALDSNLEVTFSADVDPKTLTAQSIRVIDLMNHRPVSGKLSYDAALRTAKFVPFDGWMPDGHYKATVQHRVTSSPAGKHLPATFSWEFDAPSPPPQIFHTQPYEEETDVSPKTSIQVLFSDFMDPTTITNATFQLFDSTGFAVSAKVVAPREPGPAPGMGHDGGHKLSLRAAGEVLQPGSDHAVLTPLAELKLNTKYTAKLANTIRSLKVTSFPGKEWSFTTAAIKSSSVLIGSDQEDEATTVVANGAGVYMLGQTNSALKSDSVSLGGQDLFLTKRDADGKEIWLTQFGSSGFDVGQGLAVDKDGSAYVAGLSDPNYGVSAPVTFAPLAVDGVLYKFSATGQLIKKVQLGATTGFAVAERVIVDDAGNVYVSGSFDQKLADSVSLGGTDVFLAKFDSELNRVWLETKGTVGSENGGRIALGRDGSFYWSVMTEGDFSNPTQKPTSYNSKVMVFKLDVNTRATASGWPIRVGGEEARSVANVGVDGAGNLYVGGTLYGDANTFSAGLPDGYVYKLDSQTGRQLNTLQWGGDVPEDVSSMLVQSESAIYFSGSSFGPPQPPVAQPGGGMGGGGGRPGRSLNSANVAKVDFSSEPRLVWSTSLVSKEHASANAVAVAQTGDVVVVGVAHGSFDGQVLAGGGDAFFARVDAVEGKAK